MPRSATNGKSGFVGIGGGTAYQRSLLANAPAVLPRRAAGDLAKDGREVGQGIIAHVFRDHADGQIRLLEETFCKGDALVADIICLLYTSPSPRD